MHSKLLFAAAALAPVATADTVIGLYAFHRHGDRTSKSWPPASLTNLGADEVFSSAQYFRQRYVASDAGSLRIAGISPDHAVLSKIAITAPVDNVLQNSAGVFAQGLYPPSASAGSEVLANGTKVEAPFGGYQYIPVNALAGAASSGGSESSQWLQGGSGCSQAVISSNNYFLSSEYASTFADSKSFYQSLLPVINTTFNSTTATFKNGYTIFDYINVALIHNATIPSKDLLTNTTFSRISDLANTHEWNLAYNSSDPIRAISGSVLAGQIMQSLTPLANGKPGPTFNIQFGAYGTFMSFFGLAQLENASNDFYGICDYASSMVIELHAPNATGFKTDDLTVRFLFSNGTAAEKGGLKAYPMFGQKETTISWNDFQTAMNKFAISDTTHWCQACGNTDGVCANSTSSSGSSSASSKSSGGNGVSKPVAGVIGALVTLVVILGLEAAIMLVGGLRLAKKSTLAKGPAGGAAAAAGSAKA